jgi:hypothetical protein
MTRRSIGCCVLIRISAHWRSRVWLLETTGLPVELHSPQAVGDIFPWGEQFLPILS